MKFYSYRIFVLALLVTAFALVAKYCLHRIGWDFIVLSSLHSSVISGVIFVIGFLLSATITDYKEAERIPAEIAATLENMHEDAQSIHANYPKFDFIAYKVQLHVVTKAFAGDLRNSKSHKAKAELQKLGGLHAQMETAGVPANFIVKLKQQQSVLIRHLFRVNYIQRITFIPSATVLAWAIVVIAILLLLITKIEPLAGGMSVTGVIVFILMYVLLLIGVIKTPFHDEGKTTDDVSLFLIEQTARHIAIDAEK
jgi:hypothetical protein